MILSKKIKFKLFLSIIIILIISIFLLSFKLPEIQVFKSYTRPISKVTVDDTKINKPIINAIKVNDYHKVETTNLGVKAYQQLSKLQLVLINIFTMVLIFMGFLLKVKYFD